MADRAGILHRVRRVHLVGLNGIGVSAAARILHARGYMLSGSDLGSGRATRWFALHGVRVTIGPHRAATVPPGTQLLVHTLAALPGNPEVREARRRGIPTWSYPVLLGELMRGHPGITVSGTHGKTTTTAMLATILTAAGLDPTVVVGGYVKSLGGNARAGLGPLFVAEACEYQRAFLHYAPRTIVLTNIEPDHLDTYGTFERLIRAFGRYVARLPEGGHLVANADDPVVRRVARRAKCPVTWFPTVLKPTIALKIPGAHNQANAAAAIAAAELHGVSEGTARHALARFAGSWRRFEILGTYGGVTVVDDYAHHPTAIRATLAAAAERFPRRRIVALFEPHHEHRTRVLLNDFARAFDRADHLVLAPIYRVAGREGHGRTAVESADLARLLKLRGVPVRLVDSLEQAEAVLAGMLRRGDVLLVMGAGTVTRVAHAARRFLGRGMV